MMVQSQTCRPTTRSCPSAATSATQNGPCRYVAGIATRTMHDWHACPHSSPHTNVLVNTLHAVTTRIPCPQIFSRLKRRGIRPDGVSYTTLITALASMSRFQEARRVFDAMQRDKAAIVDLAAYGAMAAALSKEGDMPAARAILVQASEAAKRAGQRPPVQAYGAVIAGYAKERDLESALDLVKEFYQEVGDVA